MADKKDTKTTYVYPSIKGIFGDVQDDSRRVAVETDKNGNVVSMREEVKAGMFGTYFDVGPYRPK
jgi:hypothetical protein